MRNLIAVLSIAVWCFSSYPASFKLSYIKISASPLLPAALVR
jgi:hypothetical protein